MDPLTEKLREASEMFQSVPGAVCSGSGVFMCEGCGQFGLSQANLSGMEHHRPTQTCPDPLCRTDSGDDHRKACRWNGPILSVLRHCGRWRRIDFRAFDVDPTQQELARRVEDKSICLHCGSTVMSGVGSHSCDVCTCRACGKPGQRDYAYCFRCGSDPSETAAEP